MKATLLTSFITLFLATPVYSQSLRVDNAYTPGVYSYVEDDGSSNSIKISGPLPTNTLGYSVRICHASSLRLCLKKDYLATTDYSFKVEIPLTFGPGDYKLQVKYYADRNLSEFGSTHTSLTIKRPNLPAPSEVEKAKSLDTWEISKKLALKNKALEIFNGLKTPRQIVEAANLWAIHNLKYERYDDKLYDASDESSAQDAFSVLRRQTAVCEGYSNLIAELLRAAGVPTKVVLGYLDGQLHSWNEVYLDGQWLPLDVTNNSVGYEHRFYLNPEKFASTHTKM